MVFFIDTYHILYFGWHAYADVAKSTQLQRRIKACLRIPCNLLARKTIIQESHVEGKYKVQDPELSCLMIANYTLRTVEIDDLLGSDLYSERIPIKVQITVLCALKGDILSPWTKH